MTRLAVFLLGLCLACAATAEMRTLLQLVDYVGVDYREAVADGEVINTAEYAEMLEFADRISSELTALGHSGDVLAAVAERLQAAITAKADAADIAALTQGLREQLMAGADLELVPIQAPDLGTATALYQTHCALCHGAEGRGDGPGAAGVEPAPTDFHDVGRARERSLFGLFNTITLGVEGTAMPPFPQLSDAERWALAFHTGGMADSGQAPDGTADGTADGDSNLLQQVVLNTPTEWAAKHDDGAEAAFWYRHHPQQLFAGTPDPLIIARRLLADSRASYRAGELAAARQAAITAYLEGFELAEAPLRNVAPALVRETETAMLAYRQAVARPNNAAEVDARFETADALLREAREALSGTELSAGVAFLSSLIILLREGLEAILVLAALIAFLVQSGRRDALRYVHAGWATALVAGGATWAVSNYLITISGATREVTEGVTALVAAAVLFYVGFWMHGNANAKRWSAYLQSKVQRALDQRTLWTLGLLSFLAVYREIFETVLFYQALWTQVGDGARHAVFGGAAVAVVALLLVAWLLTRFGMRLPLRQFFLVGSWVMVALTLIFVGKGIAALQEAGRLPITSIDGPTIDWLGIYPTTEGLGLQAALLVIGGLLVWYNRRSGKA